MRDLVKTISNAALVVGGFFIIFFGISKVTQQGDDKTVSGAVGNADIAFADVPYSQSSYGDSGGGDSGDSGK
jgi:hypothetical protein